MKRYTDFLFLFAFVLFLTACRGEEEWSMASSGFLISLGDEQANITSRATPAEIGKPVADQFQLRITKKETNSILYNGAYKSGIIQASTGNYTLEAFCGDNPELAWDTPYYKGTTEAEVLKDQTTSVNIPCKVANALLSIQFSNPDKFAQLYNSYNVKVTVGSSSLNFDNSETKKSAYFREGSKVTLTFHAIVKETGKEVSMVIENDNLPQTFAAGTHTKLSLTAATPASGTILEVDKVEVEKVTVTQTIPLEWLPKPKVTGFGGSTVLNYTETADAPAEAVIGYTASAPVQDVEFTLDFKDAQYSGYNKRYTLSELTDEERTSLTNIGIKLPEIDGISKEGSLGLSTLTANLLTDDGAEVINTLKFKVKANNRWSSEEGEDYQIKVVKPEFTVSAYPGNIWTKEFTVNPLTAEEVQSGGFTKISQNIIYQYSTDQTDWKTIGDDLRQSELQPETTYYIRGMYRGKIAGEITEVKTYPLINLVNGNLSTYSIVRGKDGTGFLGGDYGAQYEWNSWATLNVETAGKCTGTAYSYNSRSGTRPVTDIRPNSTDNTAVWIITVGYGYGGTDSNPSAVKPSELFLGVYNEKGIEYHSHPTGVKFYYKYSPYNNDKSDISVQILNDNTIIGKGELQETSTISEYKECIMHIDYDKQYINLAPNKISLVFKSGFNTSVESRESGGLTSAKTANPKFRGSELYIDDISLVYDK